MRKFYLNVYLTGRDSPILSIIATDDDRTLEEMAREIEKGLSGAAEKNSWNAVHGLDMITYVAPTLVEAFQLVESSENHLQNKLWEHGDAVS